MGMFRMSCSQRQTVRQTVRCEQTLRVCQMISRTVITPYAICPECGHGLNEKEIKKGWRNDPTDFTTECPKCHTRFLANLILSEDGQDIDKITYLCPDQLFYALKAVRRGKSKILGKVFLANNHPHLLWNMVKHHGNYELALKAFKQRLGEN